MEEIRARHVENRPFTEEELKPLYERWRKEKEYIASVLAEERERLDNLPYLRLRFLKHEADLKYTSEKQSFSVVWDAGISYRTSPNFSDRTENGVAFGDVVTGVVHDNWLKVDDALWLPLRVLPSASEPEDTDPNPWGYERIDKNLLLAPVASRSHLLHEL